VPRHKQANKFAYLASLAILARVQCNSYRVAIYVQSTTSLTAARDVSLDDVNNLQNAANEAQRKRKNVDSWWPDIADHSLHDDGDLALDCGSVFPTTPTLSMSP
jgi:hypothetical protein